MNRTFITLFFVLSLFACKKENERACLKGSGDWIEEERSIGDFHSLHLYDFIQYNLIQDSTDKIVLHCGENLVNLVSTELENGVLTIRDENSCHWLRSLPVKITVDIHFTQLDYIRSESSGLIQTLGPIQQEHILFDNFHTLCQINLELETSDAFVQLHAGSPQAVITGHSDMLTLYNSGGGKLNASQLISTSVWADNKSAGEIRANVDGGTLWYMLDGYGDTYYQGSVGEFVKVSDLGTGELIAE